MSPAFVIGDGVLGTEAIWTPTPNAGPVTLNDQGARPEWIKLRRITGLFDGPDHETPADKYPGRIGESFRPSSAGGKTVVLEGEVRSTTLQGLRSKGRALRATFAPAATQATMSVAPNATIGGPAGTFTYRPLSPGVIMDDEQASIFWRRAFQLSLRLSDPRVYFPSLAVDVTHATAAVVTNAGSAPADPVVTVTVTATGTKTISDGTRTLSFLAVPVGSLVVDFAKRTAKVGTVNVQLDVAASAWWDSHVEGIAGGATRTITQTGGTQVRVQFTPAAW